jgi:cyclase
MLPRIIPVLLLDRSCRLIKTTRFAGHTYVGDPFNVIRIFNEKEVDEICVLDIDATLDGRTPDVGFVRELAAECFMPLGYGGGIASLQTCAALFKAGVEKLVIGAQAPDGQLIHSMAREFGSQAVVASIDVARLEETWEVRTHRGQRVVDRDPLVYARRMEDAGVGEILLNNIDRDGVRQGYDLELVSSVSRAVNVPVIALGGAGDERAHLRAGLVAGASAVASGSAFVFIGPLRAVLITYPTPQEIAIDILPPSGRLT